MNTVKHTNWLLLALLIFVGQVVAAPFSSCQMKMDAAQMSMHMQQDVMSEMDMSSDMHMKQAMNHTMKMPCCGDKCDCVQGICMGVAVMTTLSFNIHLNETDIHIISIKSFQLNQASSAIFHPPILS